MTKENQTEKTGTLFPQLPLDVKSPTRIPVPGMGFVHVEVLYKHATHEIRLPCGVTMFTVGWREVQNLG